ncbi:recombinase family protein [Streptomyces sp. NPDC046939]|uniref:recombinase family protein n=1 Tax=Streptomyces sp. NPDC046939 TaxID=3155376 RepID=UPI0033F2122A
MQIRPASSGPGKPVRAALMVRVSTRKQVTGFGLQAQEAAGRAYVESRPGWVLVPDPVFRDEGVSGALIERPGMLRLEQEARHGRVDVIVVHSFDRIGRTSAAFWARVWAMEDLGVTFVSVTQSVDNATDFGREQLHFHAVRAEDERRLICERMQGGRQRKALDGGWVGGPAPWGYVIDGQARRGSRLTVDAKEARVARTAVHFIVDRGMNTAQAARELNAEGLFPRSGRPWSASNLHRRLTSSSLLKGEVVFRSPAGAGRKGAKCGPDGEPLHGASVTIAIPRIITEERAEALVQVMTARGHTAHAEASEYPLTGRIEGACGSHYVGAFLKSNGSRYYRCAGNNNGKGANTGCDDPYLAAAGMEASVLSEVRPVLADPGLASALRQSSPRALPGSEERQRERVANFAQVLTEKEAAAARADAALSGLADLDQGVKEAALRQLSDEVLIASLMLAEARAVLVEYESVSHRTRTDVELIARAAAGQVTEPAEVRRVFDLLDVRVNPLERVRQRAGVGCKVTAWHIGIGVLVPAEVTESQWGMVEEAMAAFFPRRQFVRGVVDLRTQLNGILHRLRTGCLWDEVPAEFGPPLALKDRQNTWFKRGFWAPLMQALNARGGGTAARRERLVPALEVVCGISRRDVNGALQPDSCSTS